MFTYPKVMAGVAGLIGLAAAAVAGDFDGLTPLSGTVDKVVEINRYRITDDVDPDTVGLPKKFMIDFKAKAVRPSNDSLVRRTISIKNVEHVDKQIVLQGVDEGVEGVEDALAWSLTISRKNGNALLSAVGRNVAYVVFGVCTPIKANP